jgi:hypothetical protein
VVNGQAEENTSPEKSAITGSKPKPTRAPRRRSAAPKENVTSDNIAVTEESGEAASLSALANEDAEPAKPRRRRKKTEPTEVPAA